MILNIEEMFTLLFLLQEEIKTEKAKENKDYSLMLDTLIKKVEKAINGNGLFEMIGSDNDE